MTSMSGDVPNERWEGDLEADQLDDLAAREGRDDAPDALDLSSITDTTGAPLGGRASDEALTGRVSNEQWENNLEADELDSAAAEEGADEAGGDNPM
jgi:hypothetical protein